MEACMEMIQDPNPDLLRIRTLALKEGIVYVKWGQVVDSLLKMDAAVRIKELIKSDFPEAILQTLQTWNAYGVEKVDLLTVLRKHDLNSLAEKIQIPECRPKSGIFFEVGEMVPNFTGREPQLEKLHAMLTTEKSTESIAANVVCISGLGGIGKSTLARKYAFQHFAWHGNIAWINAETLDSMRASFMRLANHLGIQLDETVSVEDITARIYATFCDTKLLLIFDNVEDKMQLKMFLPKITSPAGEMPSILISTRRTDLTPNKKKQLNLDVLTMDEAVDFIQNQVTAPSKADAQRLADKLQKLPLALQQSVAYIIDTYLDHDVNCIRNYLIKLDVRAYELLNDERFQGESDYTCTTMTTWNITLARIQEMENGQSAVNVIRTLSYLNPDSISIELVRTVCNDADAESGLKLLSKYSMIRTTPDNRVIIHRLVQDVVRLSNDSCVPVLSQLTNVIEKQINEDETRFTDFIRECTSHGLHLFQFQIKHTELMEGKSYYLSRLCYYLIHYGNYLDTLVIAQRSSSFYESWLGEGQECTIRMKWKEADAHYYLDNFTEAMQVLDKYVPIANSNLGEEHWLKLYMLHRTARVRAQLGECDKAIEIFDQIIEIWTRVNGQDSENVLEPTMGKAFALRDAGRLDEALQLFEHVHKARVEKHGKEDLRTIYAMVGIAMVTEKEGDLTKSRDAWNEVYDGYKHVYGEKHPKTIDCKDRLNSIDSKLMFESELGFVFV